METIENVTPTTVKREPDLEQHLPDINTHPAYSIKQEPKSEPDSSSININRDEFGEIIVKDEIEALAVRDNLLYHRDRSSSSDTPPATSHPSEQHVRQPNSPTSDPFPFKCKTCGCTYSTKSSLRVHERRHVKGKPFACEYCSCTCFDKSSLKTHQRIHTGVKPFKCNMCKYACSTRSNLTVHKRKHTREKPFACIYCSYASSEKSRLVRHNLSHTGEKPFKCEICSFVCTNSTSLKRHQQTHEDRSFVCKHCSFTSSDKSTLKTHERTHLKKPFKCIYCNFESLFEFALNRHEKCLHANKLLYVCNYCDKKFPSNERLVSHMKIHKGRH